MQTVSLTELLSGLTPRSALCAVKSEDLDSIAVAVVGGVKPVCYLQGADVQTAYLCFDTLQPETLAGLRAYSPNLFLSPEAWGSATADWSGFKVFHDRRALRAPCAAVLPQKTGLIDAVEFLFSDLARLASFPMVEPALIARSTSACVAEYQAIETIFVFNLVQDAEILLPLIRAMCSLDHPAPAVVHGNKFTSKPVSSEILAELRALGVKVFDLKQPAEITQFDSTLKLLVTASESTVNAHAYAHAICQVVPANVCKVTFQHGYENVGLHHHRAHDESYPEAIGFASDAILTWGCPDSYNRIAPAVRPRCHAVGMVKAMAEEATRYRVAHAAEMFSAFPLAEAGVRFRLLLAENLHSVRLADVQGKARLLHALATLAADPQIELWVRSHPAGQWLVKNSQFMPSTARFLDGALSAEVLAEFDAIITPPSTIALDAALIGLPVAVWGGGQGDVETENYTGLMRVDDVADIMTWIGQIRKDRPALLESQFRFLSGKVVAYNGIYPALTRLKDRPL